MPSPLPWSSLSRSSYLRASRRLALIGPFAFLAALGCESSPTSALPASRQQDSGRAEPPAGSRDISSGVSSAFGDAGRVDEGSPGDPVLDHARDAGAPGDLRPTQFIRAEGTHFVEGSKRHAFVGLNLWTCMSLGAANPPGDRARLGRELDALRALGVTNVRIMASAEGPNGEPFRIAPALMTAPGVYDEGVFAGLDFCLDELAQRGIRAVMVLNNYWQWSGGMAQYVSWQLGTRIPYPGGGGTYGQFTRYANRFYACPECQQAYRAHIQTVTTRVNTINGLVYRDDPTIFAWELANEPRAYPDGWTNDVAGFIKSLDQNHMVTVGSEGNWSEDFLSTHAGANIDYGTVHIWAENIGIYDPDDPTGQSLGEALTFATDTLVENEALAAQLDKPLVLEEFGLARDGWTAGGKYDPAATLTHRDTYFGAIFGWVEANMAADGTTAGDNVWAWGGEARPPSALAGDPPHETSGWYSVYDTDTSTRALLQAHASVVSRQAVPQP